MVCSHELRTQASDIVLFCSMARLTPFEVGQIKAHLYHGMGPAAMASIVKKADGQFVSKQAVCNVINKLEADPKWRGERAVVFYIFMPHTNAGFGCELCDPPCDPLEKRG